MCLKSNSVENKVMHENFVVVLMALMVVTCLLGQENCAPCDIMLYGNKSRSERR